MRHPIRFFMTVREEVHKELSKAGRTPKSVHNMIKSVSNDVVLQHAKKVGVDVPVVEGANGQEIVGGSFTDWLAAHWEDILKIVVSIVKAILALVGKHPTGACPSVDQLLAECCGVAPEDQATPGCTPDLMPFDEHKTEAHLPMKDEDAEDDKCPPAQN